MTEKLKLFVCIVGGDQAFPVLIPSSKSVSELKKAISLEKPNDLKNVDAYRLTLYKVSLLDDDSLKKNTAEAIKRDTPLKSSWDLSEYWPKSPQKNMVHVLVEVGGGVARELFYHIILFFLRLSFLPILRCYYSTSFSFLFSFNLTLPTFSDFLDDTY
jgi:hypothetical protein